MIQAINTNLMDKRFRLSKRLGNEVQLLKAKCGGADDFDSKTNLLIEKYMKLIRKCEQTR